MKWRAQTECSEPKRFEIEHDPNVGFFLYVYECGKCISDQLQDTFEIAVASAMEEYGVPEEAWKKVVN